MIEHPIVFLHIFKNAGTTFNRTLQSAYSDEEVQRLNTKKTATIEKFFTMPSELKRKIKYLTGHHPFNRANGTASGTVISTPKLTEVLGCPVVYITVLRDPIERVLSAYYYLKLGTCSGHSCHLSMKNNPLEVLLDRNSYSGILSSEQIDLISSLDNHQTRILSGFLLPEGDITPEQIFLTSEHLEEAKSNLLKMSFICSADEIDFVGMELRNKFGFPSIQDNYFDRTYRMNITPDRPQRSEIDSNLIRKIEEWNRFDVELFQFFRDNQKTINEGPVRLVEE